MYATTAACLRKQFRRGPLAFFGVGAVAVGAILFSAPVANAIPESTIKSECEDIGGTYNTATVKGHQYSSCDYTIDGDWQSDTYTDGEYTGTLDKQPPPASPGKSAVAPPPPVVSEPELAPTTSSVAPLPPAVINPGLAPG